MKGWPYQKSIIVLLAAFTLIARPFVIFSSSTMQASLSFETRMYGYLKSARKRRDSINVQEGIAEIEERNWFVHSTDVLVSFIKKWNRFLLFYLSLFFCGFFHLKRRRSVFEVTIQDNYIYTLSVLRI